VAPILEAGRDELIKVDGREVLEGISFVPTPGHSIDHAAIVLRSKGEEGLFGGDVLHHPVEIYQPEMASMFCEFPTESRGSRLILLDRAAETGATYFSSHFSDSSAGRITRKGSSYGWEFV
jgi:glyoxylase-like metal-dependent hydrolase (beta-lactamase superfamily II)